MLAGKVHNTHDERREQVALHVGVVLLDPLAHKGVKAAAAHIRRIRHDAGKTTGQFLADGGSAFELSFSRRSKKIVGTAHGGGLKLVNLVL